MVAKSKTAQTVKDALCPRTVDDIKRFYEPAEPVAAAPAIEPLIDAKAAAKLFGVCERMVYAMAQRGELPCVRFAKRVVRFDRSDILAWIDRHKVASKVKGNA
jgi:excisionase family DNA binding protein